MIPVFAAKSPQPKRKTMPPAKPSPEPFNLGKTRRTITFLLARHIFLRSDQLRAAAMIQSDSYVQTELRYLLKHHWLLSSSYLRQHDIGKAPKVYTLNTPAWDWIGEQGVPKPDRFRPSEEIGKVTPHTMLISKFGVALERYCRRTPTVQIAQYWQERLLPYTKVALPDGTATSVRPDAWVQIAIQRSDGRKQRCWVLEADNATEYQKKTREKIRALLAYRKEPYREQFGTESITYLYTVPHAHRRKLLISYIEAEIAEHEQQTGKKVRPDLFWVTDVDPAEADTDLFTAPVWHLPFKPNPAPLLDLRPSAAASRETTFSTGYLGENGMLRFYQELGQRPPMTALESDIEEIVD